jgi:hypothetical protein
MGGKSTKLKVKRTNGAGRPRKEGERYKSGDVKRSETQKEVMSVAIEARRRVDGWSEKVTDETVKSPFAGYTLGRMFLDGRITEDQRKAGDEYAEIISRYHKLTGIPFPSARAQSLFSVKGHDGEQSESHTTKARRASNAMMEAIGILLRLEDGPQIRALIHNLVVMDYEHLRGMGEQQLLWVKRGLNAFAKRKDLRHDTKSVISVGKYQARNSFNEIAG